MRAGRRTIWRTILAAMAGAALTFATVHLMPDRRDLVAPVPHVAGLSSQEFMRTLSGTFRGELVGGNAIDTLVNGNEIYSAMIAEIEAAQTSINFETYIYWSGEVADRLREAFAAKAREGVEVRLLIDWFGSQRLDTADLDALRAAGVWVERFRPPRLGQIGRVNNRTHRKIAVVDGRVGFIGGVGVADEWLEVNGGPPIWRENHYRVHGPVVAELQSAFAEHWLEATGEILQGNAFYPSISEVGEVQAQLVTYSFGGSNIDIQLALLMSLAAAQNRIVIGTPYFSPDDITIEQLVLARARGVEVDILLPGNTFGAHFFVRHASRYTWGDLLRAGVNIFEYDKALYHPKLLVVDDLLVMIGSANINERGFRHDQEANLLVVDRGFAQEQLAVFHQDLASTRRVTLEEWEGRSTTTRALDFFWALWRAHI
jgi:cardiolipin synthase A/B